MGKTFKTIDEAVIRFAGDSGDGMQLTGGRFTDTTAIVGNDLSTLPDFPAEIRAPAGSLAGVSAFQIKFSSKDIHTPGDKPDVLVATATVDTDFSTYGVSCNGSSNGEIILNVTGGAGGNEFSWTNSSKRMVFC